VPVDCRIPEHSVRNNEIPAAWEVSPAYGWPQIRAGLSPTPAEASLHAKRARAHSARVRKELEASVLYYVEAKRALDSQVLPQPI